MFHVKELLQKYGEGLAIELISGDEGLSRPIRRPEIHRPGLALSGFLKGNAERRILLFGKAEMEYLKNLSKPMRVSRLKAILSKKTPAVIVTRFRRPIKELVDICREEKISLFRSRMNTMELFSKVTVILAEEFSPTVSTHATLVEAFGIGVLLQGDSSVGKSETALGLIERGHRLIADDVVKVRKKERAYLEGIGSELTRHLLEIRGIGIINVAHLYGAVCISESARIDMIVKLEEWDDSHFYDRVGLEEKFREILGVNVPYYILPVKPGRDVVLLLETTVLNHRLKKMGYNSAKEFNVKLLQEIAKRQRKKKMPENKVVEKKNEVYL